LRSRATRNKSPPSMRQKLLVYLLQRLKCKLREEEEV
jgi:hypothetical protein